MNFPRFHARTLAGGGVFALTVLVLGMIYAKPELANNDLFKMLAQAIIVQGLVGLAMAYWFTDKARDNGHAQVEVINPPENPIPVTEEKP